MFDVVYDKDVTVTGATTSNPLISLNSGSSASYSSASGKTITFVYDVQDGDIPRRNIFIGALSIAAAFFKHPAFKKEDEWRRVSQHSA